MEDYPKNLMELEQRFSTEKSCRRYLVELRWPDGFRCPRCGERKAWPMSGGVFRCAACGYKLSATAGTIFEGTHTSLRWWFRAIWWVLSQKNGASAKSIQRILELGSYQTAWAWLHKLRRAMVRPDRDRLGGTVEVDETYVGGEKPGKRGRGALGKVLVAVAVEDKGKLGIGRIRLATIPDASQETLSGFVKQTVTRGSTVRTDDWSGYGTLAGAGYRRRIVESHRLTIAHLVVSLLKRWLAGTHQGAVSAEHLPHYLDEYTFRFNRRKSEHRGKLFFRLLQNAMQLKHTTYRQLAKGIRGNKRTHHNI